VKLFRTAQRFELTLQPQLILLQKTLLNIEGVGRMLDPDIDIWAVAHPVLKRILRERYSPLRTLREVRKRLPVWLHDAPQFPELVRDALRQLGRGEQRSVPDPLWLKLQQDSARQQQRLIVCSLLGSSLMISAALLWTLAPQHGALPPILESIAGLLAFAVGWPRSR
jgi:ubiquinone biosynthesis protein